MLFMNAKKYSFVLILVLILGLMLIGCGGGSEDVDAYESSQAVDSENADEADTANEDDGLAALASMIGNAAMGVTEAGETIYYAEAVDSSFAILVFYDVEQNANVSFVGPVSADGNAITVEDYNNGLSFTFTMEAAEGDSVVIDTGDSGYAVMQECDPIEVLEAMQSISDYSEAIA